jgi:sulfonate transport system ATP-binding protein
MVKVENITKKFENKKIITNFSHTFSNSKVTVLTGKSGVGKTTLLRIIAGLEEPDSGTVTVEGKISMAFQDSRLLPWLNVIENVMLSGCSEERRQALLKELGLSGEEKSTISSISGGMAQRVAIARTLGNDPDVLLLDEIFNGLDAVTAKHSADCILRNIKKSCTVILITHYEKMGLYMGNEFLNREELNKN